MALPVHSSLILSTRLAEPLNADTAANPPEAQTTQPAFTTSQTLLTFSGASAVVAAVWKFIAGIVNASWADERWVPAVLCGLVGLYLILKGLETAQGADKYGVVLVGLFNTAFLWSAAIGLDIGLDTTGVAQTTGGSP